MLRLQRAFHHKQPAGRTLRLQDAVRTSASTGGGGGGRVDLSTLRLLAFSLPDLDLGFLPMVQLFGCCYQQGKNSRFYGDLARWIHPLVHDHQPSHPEAHVFGGEKRVNTDVLHGVGINTYSCT